MEYINKQYRDLAATAKNYKEAYANAEPFPSIAFENFFDEDMLNEVLAEFPDMEKKADIKFNNPNEVKLASKGEHLFGPKTRAFMHYLNSEPFLLFLKELTSIERPLIPDPYFEGAGYHETKPGGFLKVHADFNKHYETKLDRRLNTLVYLNKDWKEEYGGHFELWDLEMKNCIKRVLPAFNTLAMFSTTSHSWHGLPNPLTCPPDRSRKSLALYFYTNGRPEHEVESGIEEHNTIFKARVGDEVDNQMQGYNAKQKAKDIVKDLTPPILFKLAKKIVGSEEKEN